AQTAVSKPTSVEPVEIDEVHEIARQRALARNLAECRDLLVVRRALLQQTVGQAQTDGREEELIAETVEDLDGLTKGALLCVQISCAPLDLAGGHRPPRG